MAEIKYHPKAQAEAFKSARFYDKRQPGLGGDFFDELDATIQQLRREPERKPADPTGVRSWRVSRFPFRVYYVIDPSRIRILAVAHLSRQAGYWRKRLND